MKRVLVVAPHPDDETLGCGGTILKHIHQKDDVYWLIVTDVMEAHGFSRERVLSREKEIEAVAGMYGFTDTFRLNFPTTQLDAIPMGAIVDKVSQIVRMVSPELVYIPYPGDVHTDHKAVFDAVVSCSKWFRYPSVKRILAYETLSETDFGINPDYHTFRPNVFVDISQYIEEKIQIMNIFESEVGEFPFPRSEKAIKALGSLRGAASGCEAAEAFVLLKEII